MGKLDDMRKSAAGAESIGVGVGPQRQAALGTGRHKGVERLVGGSSIHVDRLTRDPSQPREIFDEAALQELVESIESLGVLQPIRVRWDEELAMFVIVSGERRFRAAKMAGLKSVPCVIQEGELTESQRLIEQLAENIIRADLQPVEQAKAFRRLMDINGWTARQLARDLHIAEANVAKALSLLDLPESVQEQVESGLLAASVAYEVSRLDSPEERAALADRIVAEKLTRDQAIAAVQAKKPGRANATKRAKEEFQLDDGTRIIVTGPAAAAGVKAVASALKRALKQVYERSQDAAREQAA